LFWWELILVYQGFLFIFFVLHQPQLLLLPQVCQAC
jgi:hypothetical protein